MKILVTGANGFIGKNLVLRLKSLGHEVFSYDLDTKEELLKKYVRESEFIYHLAGVNRPLSEGEFTKGNLFFTDYLLHLVMEEEKHCPILYTSSIQAVLDNPYGKSKKAGEDLMLSYQSVKNKEVYIYRLHNVFGKWCKPNYNSVIATFCYNIERDIPITIHDENAMLHLVYIDDVVDEFIKCLVKQGNKVGDFYEIPLVYHCTVQELVEHLYSFKDSKKNGFIPNVENEFIKKLYSTYLSYVAEDNLSYELKMNTDIRGSFTEFFKSKQGQLSINISKPGIIKGNHYHHTKHEKFLVVSGIAVIRIRNIFNSAIKEYYVTGEKLVVIDIPAGCTHNIENIGDNDLVTLIWVNEPFDKDKPDTYYLQV